MSLDHQQRQGNSDAGSVGVSWFGNFGSLANSFPSVVSLGVGVADGNGFRVLGLGLKKNFEISNIDLLGSEFLYRTNHPYDEKFIIGFATHTPTDGL